MSGLRNLNPLRLFATGNRGRFSYERVPNGSPFDFQKYQWPAAARRISATRVLSLAIAGMVVLALLGGGGYRRVQQYREAPVAEEHNVGFYWGEYYQLNGFYNGIRTLVSPANYVAQNGYNITVPQVMDASKSNLPKEPAFDPIKYDPYPFRDASYLRDHEQVHQCYLDEGEKVAAPDVYAYPAIPQLLPQPFYGGYKELGMKDDVCWERFGRLSAYGYGYGPAEGGLGLGNESERAGSEKVTDKVGRVDYRDMDWGAAQRRCHEKNKRRFATDQPSGKTRVPRHAYVLRTWTGYHYSDQQMLALRAMINELSLKSGGQYDVHFLVHVKDSQLPIWASDELYQKTLQDNVPKEFWNISTLWSERLMEMYYPEPFPDNFANMAGASVHGVYRSAHFALQWFSQQRPEYDFYWNWEMDIRYTGHYWDFNEKIGDWGRRQPRKGMWERSRRFWIPGYHGDYANFTAFVESETRDKDVAANDIERSGPMPVWGPVQNFPHTGMLPPPLAALPPHSYDEDDYQWGVGEEADLLVFNPLFDPSLTNWVFSWDVTGYSRSLPIPPRRAAIITVARLSKRLLDTMHEETWRMKHTMFPEMWPPAVCLHHGLKALYVPHPVYFDRDWNVETMDRNFNYPKNIWESPFGWGEHNLLGSSFYYNSGFSGALWRRWMGQSEGGEGGARWEEEGSGRMCLRPVLHHPIKHEAGSVA
ncbi:hypothetical protein LTR62_008826 [Meristemomyces frigidus]|uniref:Major facilitator superfamily transporter n=1 Tax=Meristemomyces frigidus TaxID=1508187 RepID=A0AAN7TD47_9PEZI|nr:hypothetical protein LTR62_008826 [Meristemomyces frigidus]